MYLKFDEITLVGDKSKIHHDDPVVYEREMCGERVLTLDTEPCKYAGRARTYGRIYYDSADRPCVVPDRRGDFEADMMLARTFVLPERW
jgi:hypothetical protein